MLFRSALQGLHSENILVIIDEVFGVDDKVIEVAFGALVKAGARFLMMGNPTSTSGFAYRAFNDQAELYKRHTLNTLDMPDTLVTPKEKETLKKLYDWPDSDACKARLLGQFPSGSFNQLIRREVVDKAVARWPLLTPDEYRYRPSAMGVDTAWMGDDRTVIYFRQGNYSKKLFQGLHVPGPTITGLVLDFWNKYNPGTVFIDEGGPAAGGVIDSICATGRFPVRVNFGGSCIDEQYQYKRTEIWFLMKQWLEHGGCIENDEELIADLIGPEYYYQPNTKKILESKDQMKKRHLRSPDLGDALALTFALALPELEFGESMDKSHDRTSRSDSEWNWMKDNLGNRPL